MPRLQLQLERATYRPGETVRAWVRALEGGESRAGMALLRYVERTEDYTEIAWRQMTRLWHGDLATGASFAFELTLPPDAKPPFRSENGSLAWDVEVRSDEFGRDTNVEQTFDVVPPEDGYPLPAAAPLGGEPPAWVKPLFYAGPVIGGAVGYSFARVPGAVAGAGLVASGSVLEWRRRARHFAVEPPHPVRRGEKARATMRMIDASRVKGELEAELACTEHYAHRVTTGRGGSHREIEEETLYVERVPLLGAGRYADIEVPRDQPFSHSGSALSYHWTVSIRERRDNATDRIAEAPLLVLP